MIWFALILCWSISFLFAGIEAGLLALDPVRLRHRARNDERAAVRLEAMLRYPERLLITVLLVTNAADVIALLIITWELVRTCGLAGYPFAVLLALPIHLFLLSVLPKSLFRRFPFRALARLAGLLELAMAISSPVLSLGEGIWRRFLSRRNENARLFSAREELKQITVQSERGGEISSAERAMIHNVVDFTSVRVRDVMVPLAKTISIAANTLPSEVLRLSERGGIDRFPVFTDDLRPLGLVNVFDILVDTAPSSNLRGYMRRIITTSPNESAYRAVRRLRAARIGLAAVVDARKRVTGIVALEDLLRRLVRA